MARGAFQDVAEQGPGTEDPKADEDREEEDRVGRARAPVEGDPGEARPHG